MLTFDMKTVWAGGKRYIPIDFAASLADTVKFATTASLYR